MDRGTLAEKRSNNKHIEKSFLKDFVFPNPKFKSGKGEKELADTIVVFFDCLIIIQCKSKLLKGNIRRYFRETVLDACKQLRAAYNRLTNKDFKITLKNNRRDIDFDISKIKKIYTLVILEQNIPITNYNDSIKIFPEIKDLKFTPQIIDLHDLKYLMRFLDTPSDFLDYLNEREKLVTNPAYGFHTEKELFGFFISNGRKTSIKKGNLRPTEIILHGFSESMDRGSLGIKLRKKWLWISPAISSTKF